MTAETFLAVARRVLAAEEFGTRVPLRYREEVQHLPWEIFQGRLVATREQRELLAASVYVGNEEFLSLKYEHVSEVCYITRSVESYVHEPCDSPEGLTTREVRRWLRELVAQLPLATPNLERELRLAVQRAVWGARLPLTSEEAPHPLFTFGQVAYAVADAPLSRQLEARVRMLGLPAAAELAAWESEGNDRAELARVVRAAFADISLTPWTDAPLRLLDLAEAALEKEAEEAIGDWLSGLVLLLTRHLTAYDLHVFHHGGMNYPDALLLEELLHRLIRRRCWQTPRQRLALRQGWLVCGEYEGHPVPVVPTSPGELSRVLPGERLDDRRRHRLFTTPLAVPPEVLQQSLAEDVAELGAAVYFDRPYGDGKHGVEPDGTPLVASLAYSAAIAERRWRRLTEAAVPELRLPGVPVQALAAPARTACLSLTDASRVSGDFVFRRTLPGSLRRLGLTGHLLARTASGLTLYDADYQLLRTWQVDYSRGYVWREGIEWPVSCEDRHPFDSEK
jgi:hypothetical protein